MRRASRIDAKAHAGSSRASSISTPSSACSLPRSMLPDLDHGQPKFLGSSSSPTTLPYGLESFQKVVQGLGHDSGNLTTAQDGIKMERRAMTTTKRRPSGCGPRSLVPVFQRRHILGCLDIANPRARIVAEPVEAAPTHVPPPIVGGATPVDILSFWPMRNGDWASAAMRVFGGAGECWQTGTFQPLSFDSPGRGNTPPDAG